jgi:phage terminase large subunit
MKSRTLYTAYGGAGRWEDARGAVEAVSGALRYAGDTDSDDPRTYPELQQNTSSRREVVRRSWRPTTGRCMHDLPERVGIKFGHYSGNASETEYRGRSTTGFSSTRPRSSPSGEFRFLGSLLRGVERLSQALLLTCNPGGVATVGERLLSTGILSPALKRRGERKPGRLLFIPATVEDNVFLWKRPRVCPDAVGPAENIRRAHRYGDWDALSGAYFPEFDAKNTSQALSNPGHWRYRAFDYGLDMLACLWFAQDESGGAFVGELKGRTSSSPTRRG